MFSAKLEFTTPGAKKLYEGISEEEVQELISTIMNKVTLRIEATMKKPGYAPRSDDHGGEFASKHSPVLNEKLVKYVINTVRVQNGEFLWKYIVGGHRVLTTAKSRRWFFGVFLKEHPGYTRKTPGTVTMPGGAAHTLSSYVPPDNYPKRAVETVIRSGYIEKVAKQEISKFWKGVMPGGS